MTFVALLGCCLLGACDKANDNDESISNTSSDSVVEIEKVTADFLSYDTLDNFETGGWAQFGNAGANSSLSIHDGWVGLGEVRRTGKFLKFKLGTTEQTDSRAAFSSTASPSDVLAELTEKKEQGYTSLCVDMYTMYDNVYMMVYGSLTDYSIAIHGLVWPIQWTTFTYSIDTLITWYSSAKMGLDEGEMPLVGFGNDNRKYVEVYLSEFYYVK